MEGFFLGLSSGTVCLAHCLPVMVPYFLGEANGPARSAFNLIQFLLGRLLGYILFGCVAWVAGRFFFDASEYRELLFGAAYLILSLMMGAYGLAGPGGKCAVKPYHGLMGRSVFRQQRTMTITLGFLTGINLCPPFLLAFSSSAYAGNLLDSVLYFTWFFLGTSLYFVPTILLGFANMAEKLKTIGKMTALVMSLYFFYKGATMILGGVIAL